MHSQVEEFLHREQNTQISELRKAASEMIQKVQTPLMSAINFKSLYFQFREEAEAAKVLHYLNLVCALHS
jgi:hypothetical protein